MVFPATRAAINFQRAAAILAEVAQSDKGRIFGRIAYLDLARALVVLADRPSPRSNGSIISFAHRTTRH